MEMYYDDYLQLGKLLDAQHPESFKKGNSPAHDEMLFITIHQAYELWFKQILFELGYIKNVFKKVRIDDNSEDLNLVRHRLTRVNRILELLNVQISLLDTMTPLDFLEFRNLLTPASGFQSTQFRLIEATLGLQMDKRYGRDYYKRTSEGGFNKKDFRTIEVTEEKTSLLELVNSWLERLPFFEEEYWLDYKTLFDSPKELHPFWSDYRKIYQKGLTEKELSKASDFDKVFFPEAMENNSKRALSAKALKAALFIMLYRDFPVFQTSYRILDALIEIDHNMATWRHKHLVMVRRMIGMRVGTGNTTGREYLEGALQSHYIFRDLAGLSTYLIERTRLPKLPQDLIKRLGYYS